MLVSQKGQTLYRMMLVKQAVEMWIKHRMEITRGFTITVALKEATKYTGKSYKRNEYQAAVDDMTKAIAEFEAMPTL